MGLAQYKEGEGKSILLLGGYGAGKTSLYGQLATQGFKLFIMDYDLQLDPLLNYVPEEYFENIHFKRLADDTELDQITGRGRVKVPHAWQDTGKLLKNWVDDDGVNHGDFRTWDDKCVLVVDGLRSQVAAILNFALSKRGKSGHRPEMLDWEAAAAEAFGFYYTVRYAKNRRCHLIVCSHLQRLSYDISTIMTDDELKDEAKKESTQQSRINIRRISTFNQFPTGVTKNFSEAFGGMFPYVVMAKRDAAGRPYIQTVPDEDVILRVPAPVSGLPRKLTNYQTGMAELLQFGTNRKEKTNG